MDRKIDFIVTWVDESDISWQKSKQNYIKDYDQSMNSDARFRNWDFLKYWFRSVEQHAPWVNKVFFVTEGHLPDWINSDYEKLQIVKHNDYIDEAYLPTFNSNAIELNFDKIEGLSECFVSFNDDMFLNSDVEVDDFFMDGTPRDMGVFSPIAPFRNTIDGIVLNNLDIINDYFDRKSIVRKTPLKFFNLKYKKHILKNFLVLPWNNILGFYDNHIPVSYRKETFSKVWNIEKNELEKTTSHRFRTREDVNHWLMRYWQLCTGEFVPRSADFGVYYNIGNEIEAILKDIKSSSHKVICLNDTDTLENFEKLKKSLNKELGRKYNVKSSFEK